MHHLVSGISFLRHSLAQIILLMMSHAPVHLPHAHHSHYLVYIMQFLRLQLKLKLVSVILFSNSYY